MKEKEVKERLKKVGGSWRVFIKWMAGQTMGMNPDGTADYYEYDVNRFIRYKCNPKNEPKEDFD